MIIFNIIIIYIYTIYILATLFYNNIIIIYTGYTVL